MHYVPNGALAVEVRQESVELTQLASVVSLADLGVKHLRGLVGWLVGWLCRQQSIQQGGLTLMGCSWD